jgi:carboxylate-amine ligase
VHTGRPVPAVELAKRLLATARPMLADYGELERVTRWLWELIKGGDGASRQRHAAARRGRLTDVVDHLIGQTAATSTGA